MNQDDSRCCGTGTCLINDQGVCWCGQRWDGEKMCFAAAQQMPAETTPAADLDSGTSRPARLAT